MNDQKTTIQKYQHVVIVACILFTALSTNSAIAQTGERKIVLRASMLINETAVGDESPLVDEQELAGDPASGKGGSPQSPFFPGWALWPYPVHVAVDLGVRHRVTRLFFYNETGKSEITVSWGRPFGWHDKPVTLDKYKGWVEVPLGVETRWLRITLAKPVSLPEMVAYGEPLEKPAPVVLKQSAKARKQIPMDQLIGSNVFIDDPVETIAEAGGFAREYHSWLWDVEAADRKRRFQPSGAGGGNLWFFDDYYAGLKKRGVTVSPCIQGCVPDLFGGQNREYKPAPQGMNPEDPAAYALHSAHLFQYAARYGSKPVDDSMLDLGPGQPRKSGLGLLRYIENWNEPDRSWNDRQGRFHPYELAAMASADYDGHKGALGAGHGVKSADPGMKMALAGLAGLDMPYLRAMKLWANWNRDGSFPADVINLHHYCSSNNEQWGKPNGRGISPEEDHLREKIAAFVDWRNANVPSAELWVTEFGYDTNPASPLHAPAIGSMSAEQVQAAWLARGYLALAAAGVDRAAMFMLRDVKSAGGGVFETCGLVTEKGHWKPKPSLSFVATLKNRLAGMTFEREMKSGNSNVLIYRFTSPTAKAYAVWSPSSEDKHVKGFSLKISANSATLIQLADGRTTGLSSPLPVTAGNVVVDVSETPVLVIAR